MCGPAISSFILTFLLCRGSSCTLENVQTNMPRREGQHCMVNRNLWISEQDLENLSHLIATRSPLGVQRHWVYWIINIMNNNTPLKCRMHLNAGVLQSGLQCDSQLPVKHTAIPQNRLPIDYTNPVWHLHVCHILFCVPTQGWHLIT